MEDKVIKNHYAAEYVYNAYKNTQTCGVVEEDKAYGLKKILEPVGLIAAVIPTTNPTSTAIYKSLISLKTRNAIIISPHPRAKKSTIEAAKVVLEAAVAAGAPEGIIGWIDIPSLDLTNMVFMGGGASIIKHFGNNKNKKVQFVTDVCANAKGCEAAVKSIMRAKQMRKEARA